MDMCTLWCLQEKKYSACFFITFRNFGTLRFSTQATAIHKTYLIQWYIIPTLLFSVLIHKWLQWQSVGLPMVLGRTCVAMTQPSLGSEDSNT